MKWIIEYTDGKSISENEVNFKYVDKENIGLFYFLDHNGDKYGIDLKNLTFFNNNKIYDFMIRGQFEVVQFKSANVSWGEVMKENITSWNLGIQNENESYVMSITPNREIHLLAKKRFS